MSIDSRERPPEAGDEPMRAENGGAATVAGAAPVLSARTVLVTGATGFLGRALVAALGRAGVPDGRLRLLVRSRDAALRHGLPEPALVEGSLADRTALEQAAGDVDGVVHLAGLTRALSTDDLFATNEAGVARVAAAVASVAAGARFVLVSSLAAAGPSTDGRGSAAAPAECRPCSSYGASKLAGERRLLDHSPRLDWCVIRPPIVYGPGDDATRLLFRQALAPLAVVPWRARPLSVIHVEDVADALVHAVARRGVHGFLPLAGPADVDTTALVRAIAAACGRTPRIVRVPMLVPRAIAPLVELVQRLRGRPGFFNSDKMREAAASGWVADPAPVRDALGFAPAIALDSGLLATARAEGLVPVAR